MPASPARVYLDNAATSFPKPPSVAAAMVRFMSEVGVAPGRGSHASSSAAAAIVRDARRTIASLLALPETADDAPSRVIFTLNGTEALNLAIKGFVRRAANERAALPHVLTTTLEHNSVLRPLRALEDAGLCTVQRLRAADPEGYLDPGAFAAALRGRPEGTLVVTHHVSNVTGAIQPIPEIGAICRASGAPLLLDAAQSAGHVPIDAGALGASLIAFAGHKGLYGPLGTGVLYVAEGMESRLDPLVEGGTGSHSEREAQPEALPDRFESGSMNAVGIAGLGAGVRWVQDRSVAAIEAHGRALSSAFLDAIPDSGVTLLGPARAEGRTPVFSVALEGAAPQEVAAALESGFGLLTRAGLHCAPGVHRALGTFPDGAVRVSFGALSAPEDALAAAQALREIASALRPLR